MAGWVAVALLAVAGFAAFGNPGPSAQQVRLDALEASMGHIAGAYAGLGFTQLGVSAGPAEDIPTLASESTSPAGGEEAGEEDTSSGTVVDPDTGWLSEVEVRALISLYFDPVDVNKAVRVAWCESRFDPESTNLRTGGIGIFQHLPQYWEERAEEAGFAGADPTDPEASIAAAAWAVYQGGGWDVFACQG